MIDSKRVNTISLLIIALLVVSFISFIVESLPILYAGFFTLIVGVLLSYCNNRSDIYYSKRLFYIVFIIYYICAFIISFVFDKSQFFYMSDPMKDIDMVNSTPSFDSPTILGYLYLCYFELADNNALFNICLNLYSNMGRDLFGQIPVFYITQMITAFGVWSSVLIYKLIRYYFDSRQSFKYALSFCLLSCFFLYSSVIVRDIVICFFFLAGFNIALSEYKTWKLILLVLILFIIWGIRLYSGLFFSVIVFLYVYKNIRRTKWKFVLIPLLIIGVIWGLAQSGAIIEQSSEELSNYQEFSEGRNVQGGLSNSFNGLPVGIKQVVMLLFSQFLPFPPYSVLLEASTVPQFFLGTICAVNSVWWFFVFYTMIVLLFFRGNITKLPFELLYSLGISIVFIILNTAQIDIRRMMPVYPLLYLVYLYIRNGVSSLTIRSIGGYLGLGYFLIIVLYTFIKG